MRETNLNDSLERVGTLALEWRERAERYETALQLIASFEGQTLISVEHGQPYSIGANAAFEECASFARSALLLASNTEGGKNG